jgi:hypothetical protein
MSLDWWEYYEINHNVKNLRKEVEDLKKKIEELGAHKRKKTCPLLSWFKRGEDQND